MRNRRYRVTFTRHVAQTVDVLVDAPDEETAQEKASCHDLSEEEITREKESSVDCLSVTEVSPE